MIRAESLTKRFDDLLAVNGVTFEVPAGQILVLLGPNGAGKTTTVRMITSVLRPTSGTASVAGFDVVKNPDRVRGLVGVLTEHHGLYGRMSAVEYLDFYGELYGLERTLRRRRSDELLEQFGLAPVRKKRLGEYSKGMRQKLALVRALLHEPPALLLDEPTSAMDPESARIVREAILLLRSTERAIILCTHNLPEAEILADQVSIIRRGKIILQGATADLKRELLGPVEFEARLAAPLDGWSRPALAALEAFKGTRITGQGPDWMRFCSECPETANPQLLRLLLDLPLAVVSFGEVPRSLEQVYIKAVHQAEQEESYVG
jgi:ABC-2 type transport system ATP-binding protein